MPRHIDSRHRIRIEAPVAKCFRFFTPAGEEHWVDGWAPRYLHPEGRATVQGMIFTTGSGDETTIWSLADFDTAQHYARYTRVTPASRAGFVEVRCTTDGERATVVDVRYTLTALTPAGEKVLEKFEGDSFVRMIEGWKTEIERRLPGLLEIEIP